MTDYTRPSTLKLNRPAAALTTRSRSGASTSAPAPRNTAAAAIAATATAAVRADNSGQDDRSATATRTVRSETLLQGRSHVSIVHNGETYQLRATRLGKLILTK